MMSPCARSVMTSARAGGAYSRAARNERSVPRARWVDADAALRVRGADSSSRPFVSQEAISFLASADSAARRRRCPRVFSRRSQCRRVRFTDSAPPSYRAPVGETRTVEQSAQRDVQLRCRHRSCRERVIPTGTRELPTVFVGAAVLGDSKAFSPGAPSYSRSSSRPCSLGDGRVETRTDAFQMSRPCRGLGRSDRRVVRNLERASVALADQRPG